jgi:hypothetical protein
MTEKTNPSESTELNFSPQDFTPEELNSPNEGAEETAEPSTSDKTAELQKHKIKYNGADEEYTLDDLKMLAQKGRNYDHVLQERDSAKNSQEMQILADLAKNAGMKDVATFVKELQKNYLDMKIENRVRQLESEGLPTEHAKRMAELELKADSGKQVQEQQAQPDEGVDAFVELMSEFPETQEWKSLSDFPPEVRKMIDEGKKPIVAYTKYLAQKAEQEKAVALQNKQAIERDTGSFKSGKTEKPDDFLAGLGFGK